MSDCSFLPSSPPPPPYLFFHFLFFPLGPTTSFEASSMASISTSINLAPPHLAVEIAPCPHGVPLVCRNELNPPRLFPLHCNVDVSSTLGNDLICSNDNFATTLLLQLLLAPVSAVSLLTISTAVVVVVVAKSSSLLPPPLLLLPSAPSAFFFLFIASGNNNVKSTSNRNSSNAPSFKYGTG